jgi:serine/threonine protein kinase
LKRLNKVSAPVSQADNIGAELARMLEEKRIQRQDAWSALCGDSSIAPLRLDYSTIKMSELLGRGKFAAVYHGELRGSAGSQAVAVKVAQFKGNDTHQWTPLATPRGSIAPRITAEEVALAAAAKAALTTDQQEVDAQGRAIPPLVCSEEFHREISALSALAHCAQVVKLVGYTQAPLTVVLELLPEGSLHVSLQDPLWQVSQTALQHFQYPLVA